VATDVGVGDAEVAVIDVAPADGTTAATLTVYKPDGTSDTITASGGALEPIPDSSDTSQQWTADTPVVYDAAGKWVLHWDVTGTGESAEDLEVFVVASPVAGGPTWTPGRSRVANYVPHRTLAKLLTSTIESQDAYAFTFDSTTLPTGVMCDRLIADGVDWVTALVTPLNARSEPLAALVAALWAAVAVERSWPNDDQSLQRANDMEKRLDSMLAALIRSNDEANNGTDDGFDIVYPVWSFPAADPRYDSNCYW
jgi:hypothetical protein